MTYLDIESSYTQLYRLFIMRQNHSISQFTMTFMDIYFPLSISMYIEMMFSVDKEEKNIPLLSDL